MASGSQRQPQPMYRDHDGFTERVLLKMSGAVPPAKCNLHLVANHPENASREDLRELQAAVQRRQLAEDVMHLGGTYFPGLDAIKKANETQETSATMKERIKDMQKRHIDNVRTMYEWQAQDYHDEMLDLARSKPGITDPGIEAFYKAARTDFDITSTFDDHLDKLNHAYLTGLMPLIRERDMYRQREEIEQRRRDQQFPGSIQEFHAIRNKDVQIRIATFLTSDEATRERMMDKFKWPWLHVAPLVDEFKNTESFRQECQSLLRNIEVRDPRKARKESQNAVPT
ncbi:hypothetical protein GY45DRAFT_1328231 [Cubamyces sp. BRFM 1775]|nr:hypothetical protein GY45DRAFT_1328231 [Cubamyces sp. BRFM 1775]